MAERRRGLLAAALCLLASAAHAADCPHTFLGRVAATAAGLRVEQAPAAGLQAGDLLVQLNDQTLHDCDDLIYATDRLRESSAAALVLVRRGDKAEAVVLSAPRAPEPEPTPAPRAEADPTLAPRPLATSEREAVRTALQELDLAGFGRATRARLPLAAAHPYVEQVGQLRASYDGLRRGNNPALAAAEPLLAYYETVAEILAYRESQAAGSGRSRRLADASFEYTMGSPVGRWLERYPFLEQSIVYPAERVTVISARGERSGRWLPDRAVEILVTRAIAETELLQAP